jgi:hypothetical protein
MKKMTLWMVFIAFFSGAVPAREVITQSALRKDKIDRGVYLELFGASNLVGISYDSRIGPDSKLGYRIGMSYAFVANSFFGSSSSTKGLSSPLEVNYLFGKNKSKLEVGVGVSLGLYTERSSYTAFLYPADGVIPPTQEMNVYKKSFGYYLFSTMGYRYQANRGFLFRIGINPSFNFGDRYGINKHPPLYPYLSFGYSF